MKLKVRPDDASMLQMNDWLAELREDGCAEPAAEGRAEGRAEPPAEGRAEPPADSPAEGRAEGGAEPASGDARPEAPAESAAPAELAGPIESAASAGGTVRAVIGDQLRMPIMWCEMGTCISWHADPAALGEGDARARAIGAGWRIDAFGRLACPRCQQTDPGFRASWPVVLWDRYTAIARATRIAAVSSDWLARRHPAADTMPAADALNVSQRPADYVVPVAARA